MTVADDVTLDDLILAKDDLSGADIKVRKSTGSSTSHFFIHIRKDLKNTWVGKLNITIPKKHYDTHCMMGRAGGSSELIIFFF